MENKYSKQCAATMVKQVRWVFVDSSTTIFSIQTCVMGHKKDRLAEAILMSVHIICQHMFRWRAEENDLFIIIKYPPYIFHY